MAHTPLRMSLSPAGSSLLALGCVGMFATAFPADAQTSQPDADTPATLGGVTVTDTAIDDDGGYKIDRLDSPKYTAPLIDTPRSITVIGEQALKDTASTTLAEALRTVPGITMGAGEGGNPIGDRPFIRGSDASQSTYYDGVRDLAAQARETFDIQEIEVVKGSDSVTNGAGNAGGSINIVSKHPTTERFIKVDGSYGSADYKRVTVDINQPLNDFVGIRLNGMYHDQDVAGRAVVWQKRWGIAPALRIGLTGPTSLEFEWYHMHTDELPDEGVPYYTTLANQGVVNGQSAPVTTAQRPRDVFYGLVSRDFHHSTTDEGSIRFRHEFSDTLKFRNTARYSNVSQDYLWTQPDDSKGNVATYGTVSRRSNSRYSNQTGFVDQADLSGTAETGALSHSFVATAEYSWQKSYFGTFVSNAATGAAIAGGTSGTCLPRQVGASSSYNCTTLANPNPYDPWTGTIVRSLPKTRTMANSTTWSASVGDTISLGDHWKLNLGGRFDHYHTNASPGLVATATTPRIWYHQTNDIFTYAAGLIYKPVANGSLYVSTSTAAIPPGSFLAQGLEDNALTTSATITADDLKVQKTTSYEVGTKWNLFNDALALTLDLFQTKTSNARVANVDGTISYVGTKRVRGVEFGYTGNITDRWSIFGGYSYMPSKILKTSSGASASLLYTVGKPFPNTPKNSFTAFTTYKITPKLTLGGGAIYMSRVYGGFSAGTTTVNGVANVPATRATYVPDYWRFDANASYELNRWITLKINALNLTDKLYYDQAFATHYAHQAAGRTVIGTISVRY